jgi:hypothetical protein
MGFDHWSVFWTPSPVKKHDKVKFHAIKRTRNAICIIPKKFAVGHPEGRDTRGTSKHFIWVGMGMNETGNGSVGSCFNMHQSRYESNQIVQAGFRSGSLIHIYGSEKKYLMMWNTELETQNVFFLDFELVKLPHFSHIFSST